MREKLVDYYKSHSFWLHLVIIIVLFLVTYALRHYLFLDDNLILKSSQKEIRTEEDLEKAYGGLHFIWSIFNIMSLFKIAYSAVFIAAFVSIFNKLNFKALLKLALFALFVFVLENFAYTFYYLIFSPEVIKEMGANVFSLQNLFEGGFLRFLFGQLSLFNILYLVILAEMIRGIEWKKTINPTIIYVTVFLAFLVKLLLGYFIF